VLVSALLLLLAMAPVVVGGPSQSSSLQLLLLLLLHLADATTIFSKTRRTIFAVAVAAETVFFFLLPLLPGVLVAGGQPDEHTDHGERDARVREELDGRVGDQVRAGNHLKLGGKYILIFKFIFFLILNDYS
jgi:hypothetical protein